MTDQNFLSSNFEDMMRAAVRPADPTPEVLERILSEVNRKARAVEPLQLPRGRLMSRRTIFWTAAGAVLLVLVTFMMLVSPQRVLAEIRHFFEIFVPGYGFVQDEDSLRMILSPVRLERDGSWVTVEQAFTDSTRTLIVPGARFYGGAETLTSCVNLDHHEPYLKMEDSTGEEASLDLISRKRGLEFPPIPSDVQDVTLIMEWVWNCGNEPDWEIPLHFEAAPPGTVIPVIAVEEIIPTIEPTPEAAVSETSAVISVRPVVNLEKVIETGNGYIFGGMLSWEENFANQQRYDMPMADGLQLVDANQASFVVENTNPYDLQMSDAEPRENEMRWAYQVNGKDLTGPLTLTIPTLIKFVEDMSRNMTFDLDFGANPRSGLAWGVDRQFELDGKKFRLIKLEYWIDPEYPDYQEIQYSFMVDPGIRSVFIDSFCPEQPPDPGSMGGGGGSSGTTEVSDGVLKGYTSIPTPPTGVCTFSVTGIEYEDLVPWQFEIPLPDK